MNIDLRVYMSKGFRNMLIGAGGALLNWFLLYFITSHFGLWYLYSEVIATGCAWFFNYNANILLRVISVHGEEQTERKR
jgi:putative flippase GtrA